MTLDQAIQSFKSWCQGDDGMDELEFKEYVTEKYTAEKVLEGRIEEGRCADSVLRLKSPLPFSGNYHATMGAYLRDRDEILQAELAQLKEEK